ncbi:MAG: carboxylesterase/lipase family protein [Microbacteriaceae bacterium]|nr:carboxylesterase/lipase family protein [Microbacteriaceae bacterium]
MTVVATAAGLVRGTTTVTRRADVESYLGIPFAAPTTGRRFLAPQPVEPWEGTRDARRLAAAAPQNADPVLVDGGFWQPPTDEATCLNLNVWTPRADDLERPVLVWIHGGAYVTGSNATGYNNGAELAASLDVVVVSINYRLGALGFLHLEPLLGPDYADAANTAVLDWVLALQWVQENIRAFGGDPGRVTVFGESAGAAAVGTLLGMPAAQGLFARAILQSGTAERARAAEDSSAVVHELLEAAGLRESEAERLLDLPISELLAAQARVGEAHAARVIGLPLPFQPTIDGRILPRLPLEAIAAGCSADVDLLAGTNLNEAAFFTMVRPKTRGDGRSPLERLEALLAEDAPDDPATALIDYRERLDALLGSPATDEQVFESYLSDRLYRQPTNRLLAAREGARGGTYAYLFTWPSPLMGGALGSCHALEVPFVFRQLDRIESASLVGDRPPVELSEWISGAWVEFARRGAPRAPALPDWPAYAEPARATMILDTPPRLVLDPRGSLREFWSAGVPA